MIHHLPTPPRRMDDSDILVLLNSNVLRDKLKAKKHVEEKYRAVIQHSISDKYPELGATETDIVLDGTFDRLVQYSKTREIYLKNGSFGPLLAVISTYKALEIIRKIKRREDLLTKNLSKIWFIRHEETRERLSITEVRDLLIELRAELEGHPKLHFVFQALSNLILKCNGHTLKKLNTPTAYAISQEIRKTFGKRIPSEEVRILQSELKTITHKVMEDNGWHFGVPHS